MITAITAVAIAWPPLSLLLALALGRYLKELDRAH